MKIKDLLLLLLLLLPHRVALPTTPQQLNGNVSLALLLTVTTNIIGIFTMPFVLPHIANMSALSSATAGAAQVVLEPFPLMLQLCQTILVPTLLGAAVRGLIPGAAAAIDRHKKLLSYINAGLLASVPWMQVGSLSAALLPIELKAWLRTNFGLSSNAAVGLAAQPKVLEALPRLGKLLRKLCLRYVSCPVPHRSARRLHSAWASRLVPSLQQQLLRWVCTSCS